MEAGEIKKMLDFIKKSDILLASPSVVGFVYFGRNLPILKLNILFVGIPRHGVLSERTAHILGDTCMESDAGFVLLHLSSRLHSPISQSQFNSAGTPLRAGVNRNRNAMNCNAMN
jgi:hypothetical protein